LFAGDAVPAVERREHLERPSLALRRTTAGDAISAAAARRIAIAAQGLGEGRPAPENIGPRHLRAVVGRLGLLQIDSVSVLARAHYLPLFSRLGPYARELLDTAAWGKRPRRMFEYWAHEASLLPVEMQPLFRWRMDRAAALQGLYGELAAFAVARRDFVETVLAEVGARGPLVSGDLEGPRGVGGWWGWSDAKRALELLFWMGRLTTATRRGFERVYDLPERVLPAAVLAVPTPSPREAHRALLALAARALGVASEADLRDYFRLDIADTRPLLAELVEAGELLAVRVAGWAQPAYLHRDARRPRSVAARALLALPDRDLHAGREAGAWLLRAAVPAGRGAGGARRSQDEPRDGRVTGAGGACRSARPGRNGFGAGGRVAADGGLAGIGAGDRAASGRPGGAAGGGSHLERFKHPKRKETLHTPRRG
jgi:uncharacterized protein YcaQ